MILKFARISAGQLKELTDYIESKDNEMNFELSKKETIERTAQQRHPIVSLKKTKSDCQSKTSNATCPQTISFDITLEIKETISAIVMPDRYSGDNWKHQQVPRCFVRRIFEILELFPCKQPN